ncbi:outer membrane lipoprotein carrier protein LolA [Streptomyces rubradiris]|uniref:LolA family protein n=1 Tax=Streptomyces rubradiris TaxID=285531 RepID=UPI0033E4BA67
MAPYESGDTVGAAHEGAERDGAPRSGRRKAARYAVPVAVAGVAAATIGLVPALAESGDPDLPKITAQQLIDKMAESDVRRLSGTVKITTDLGLPDLGGLEDGLLSGDGHGGSGDGSSADPRSRLTELASGMHTLRVAADGPDRQKVSLLERGAEYSLIHDGKDVWGYDSKSNEVYHSTAAGTGEERRAEPPATPEDFAEEALKAVDDTTSVTVDGTAQVAGRDAYKLLIRPRQSGTTVGAVSIAVDAKTYMPLKFTLTPRSGGAAVVDAGFTQVSFARPAASTFDFTPPKGAKVTEEKDTAARTPAPEHDEDLTGHLGGPEVIGKGWTSVATLDTGAKGGLPTGSQGGDLGGFLGSLGDPVSGKFGKGTVFSTRLVNALITDDGKVYAGLVTKETLVKAADAGK